MRSSFPGGGSQGAPADGRERGAPAARRAGEPAGPIPAGIEGRSRGPGSVETGFEAGARKAVAAASRVARSRVAFAPAFVPVLVAALVVALGSAPARALDFGASAGAGVSGNCQRESSGQFNGGNLINATQAAAGRTGATFCSGYPAGGWTGLAYSYASLGTGQLKVYATSQGPEAAASLFPTGEPKNVRAQASARFFDTFALIPPAGYTDTLARIEVHLDVTESTSLAGGADGLKNQASVFWRLGANGIQSFNHCDMSGALTPFDFCPNFSPSIVIEVFVPISDPRVSFFAELSATTVNNATADASATGALSFVLPAGFTFESESGALLGATSPAPVSVALSGSPDPATATESLTYDLVVTNGGSDPATEVTLIDMLPGGMDLVSASSSQGACSSSTGLVTCALGTLDGGAAATVTIVGIPMAFGEITNTAAVIANERDPDPSDNRATLTTTVDLPPVFSGGGKISEVNDFLGYVQPLQSRTNLPGGTTSFDLMIVYGPSIDAGTFGATLDGAPLAGFAPIPGRIQTVPIPLAPGRSVLGLTVNGLKSNGQTGTDRDRLVFSVP